MYSAHLFGKLRFTRRCETETARTNLFPNWNLGARLEGMRITLAVVAVGLVVLGLWLISIGFTAEEPAAAITGPQISATPQTTAGPALLGTALLAGGVSFFVLLLRRR